MHNLENLFVPIRREENPEINTQVSTASTTVHTSLMCNKRNLQAKFVM